MKHLIDTSIHGKSIEEINNILISAGLLIGRDWQGQYSMISSDELGDVWNNNIVGIRTELASFDNLHDMRDYIVTSLNNIISFAELHGYKSKSELTLNQLNQ